MLKRLIFITFLSLSFVVPTRANAQVTVPLRAVAQSPTLPATDSASISAQLATQSGSLASSSAAVEQKIQEKKDQDITETGGKQKSVLAAYLDQHPIGKLSWNNPLQHLIRRAIENGLPANIIVLMMLFPFIASVIAISRHIVGLKGFGIYIPAVLSVAFVSTGIIPGTVVFLAVLLSAIYARKVVKILRLPLLPRTAMLLWGVSLSILGLLVLASFLDISSIVSLNIFPILIIILLTENFMESQLFKSQKEAISIAFETLVIAIFCAFIISWDLIQQFVILRPEISLLVVAILNLVIGRYTGLRLLEYLRFHAITKDEE